MKQKKYVGLKICALTAVVSLFAASMAFAAEQVEARSVNGTQVEAADYVSREVKISVPEQNGIPAHTMYAIITLPGSATKDAPVPAVVMMHGTGSNLHEVNGGFDMAAEQFAKSGIASIRFDFIGTGTGKEANYIYYNYTSASQDAKTAADYIAALNNVDGSKIGVMGWSQGGTDALLAAADYPDTFHSVVTWAGALDLTGLFPDFNKSYAEAQEKGSVDMTFDWRTSLPVGAQWFREVKDTDALAKAKTIPAPILTINGTGDTIVDPASGKVIADAAQNKASRNLMIDGMDHTFNMFTGDYSAINQAIGASADFFKETLNPAAGK